MQDWVRNTLTVLGPDVEIRKFEHSMLNDSGNYHLLEYYIPIPKRVER